MNLYEYRERYKEQLLELIPIVRNGVIKHCDETFKGICKLTRDLRLSLVITVYQEQVFDDYVGLLEDYKNCGYKWPRGEKQPRLEWLDEQEQILNKL